MLYYILNMTFMFINFSHSVSMTGRCVTNSNNLTARSLYFDKESQKKKMKGVEQYLGTSFIL